MTPDLSSSEGSVHRDIDRALAVAGITGVVPTPLDQLAATAGINETLDIAEFNGMQRRARVGKIRRFAGAIFFRERVVLVDLTKGAGSKRWIQAHELTHKLLPWHERNAYLDDDRTLTVDALEQQEREANIGAERILFQGDVFFEWALGFRNGAAVAIQLAPEFATSITATLRYYVRNHPEPIALIATGRAVQEGYARVAYVEGSKAYTSRFGSPRALFPSGRIPVNSTRQLDGVAAAIRQARSERPVIAFEPLTTHDVNGDDVLMDVEVFDNSYNTFLIVQPHRRVPLGRRLRVVPALS
jgi:hypothetical protein